MRWVRVDVGIASDPKMQKLADALKVKRAHAIGLFVSTLCQFPDHARTGNVADIPDVMLEDWAGWKGRSGVFATAFRTIMCRDSVVSGWEKHNGAAVRKADTDAERQAEYRAKKAATSPDNPPPVTRDNTRDVTRHVHRDGTGRDVTASDEAVSSATATSLADHFTDPAHRSAYERARKVARFPDALDATLVGMSQGQGGPAGKACTWHQLGTAMLEAQAAGRDISAMTLRTFAAKVEPVPTKPAVSLWRDDPPGTVRDGSGNIITQGVA